MTQPRRKSLSFYLKQRYPIEIVECEEGGFFAEMPDLPGCMTQGKTFTRTCNLIEKARESWITVAHKKGLEIPLPHSSKRRGLRPDVHLFETPGWPSRAAHVRKSNYTEAA